MAQVKLDIGNRQASREIEARAGVEFKDTQARHKELVKDRGTLLETATHDSPLDPQVIRQRRENLSGWQRKYDDQLSEDNWNDVLLQYRATGVPGVIAERTGLKAKQVEHLLYVGLVRLGKPAIHAYCVDEAETNMKLIEATEKKKKALQAPEAKKAVQKRVLEEATVAQELLNTSADLGQAAHIYLSKMIKAMAQLPEINPETLSHDNILNLMKVMDAYSKTVERAIKLKRLTTGQPTDLLGVQVGIMLDKLPPEALAKFAETGELPKQLRNPDQDTDTFDPERPLDVDFEEIPDEELGTSYAGYHDGLKQDE